MFLLLNLFYSISQFYFIIQTSTFVSSFLSAFRGSFDVKKRRKTFDGCLFCFGWAARKNLAFFTFYNVFYRTSTTLTLVYRPVSPFSYCIGPQGVTRLHFQHLTEVTRGVCLVQDVSEVSDFKTLATFCLSPAADLRLSPQSKISRSFAHNTKQESDAVT